jgi:hypothetical protein
MVTSILDCADYLRGTQFIIYETIERRYLWEMVGYSPTIYIWNKIQTRRANDGCSRAI